MCQLSGLKTIKQSVLHEPFSSKIFYLRINLFCFEFTLVMEEQILKG